MAISSELIGSLGAGEVTQSRFWFNNAERRAEQLEKSWNVPRGNYLFAWQGVLTAAYASGTNQILVNGQVLAELPNSSNRSQPIGGHTLLYNVATIALTGVGRKQFEADPYVMFVRVK